MPNKGKHFYQFGPYRIDPAHRQLLRESRPVPLQPKAFDILMMLIQHSEQTVLKDDLMKTVWPETCVEESNLAQNIFVLRKALGDAVDEKRYIVTVPGRGYRFAEKVQLIEEDELATDSGEKVVVESHTRSRLKIEHRGALVGPLLEGRWMVALATLAIAIVGSAGAILYLYAHRTAKLTEKDTVVLADFSNRTGDSVFDDALKTALMVSLKQSPFLNVLSDTKVEATLRLMSRPVSTPLTSDVTLEVCQRAGSKVFIAGSIAGLGSQYVLGLKAVNCQNGDLLVADQVTAGAKEKVLDRLGEAASKLRSELGESLATLHQFDVPLVEATTSSLDALKEYSLGEKAFRESTVADALPYYQRAIEIDPTFAVAYEAVGNAYWGMAELGRARDYFIKAFQLREHASARERLHITADYYSGVTGEVDKAAEIYREEIQTYPSEFAAHLDLGTMYGTKGEYEKAREENVLSLRLAPDNVAPYGTLVNSLMALQRFDVAREVIQETQARKVDDFLIYDALYAMDFLHGDSAAMAKDQQWFSGRPEENFGLSLASDTEAYAGHLHRARELSQRSADSAARVDSKETAAVWLENSALREAAFGNAAEAKRDAGDGLKLAQSSPGASAEAALAFAMAGDATRAEAIARELNEQFPLDTQMQSLWLPAIQAQLALNRKNSAAALTSLRSASAVEFGQIAFLANISCLYPTYIRGEAYLAAGEGREAAAEFQKILDHSGLVWNCWTGALSRLGLARANASQINTSQGADAEIARKKALAAYKDFLTLWNDADSEIPVLREARSEYAKLQ